MKGQVMLRGVNAIQVFCTQGYEWGVYRVAELKRTFLLFSFNDREEALKCGTALAKLLGVPFKNSGGGQMLEEDAGAEVYAEQIDKYIEKKHSERPKVRRVTGILERIGQLKDAGKDDEEIVEALVPLYVEAGRSESYARSTVRWYLREDRKVNQVEKSDLV